jgi:hypothetical protein
MQSFSSVSNTALVPDAYTGNYFAANMHLTSDNKWDGGGSEVEQNSRILFRTYVDFDSNNNPGNGNI